VAGDHGQHRSTVPSIDHDEGKEPTAHGLQPASIDLHLLRVGMESAADPPTLLDLREDTAPAGSCQAELADLAIEASAVALAKPRLARLHPIEQLGSARSEPLVLGS
jgi:hypothetical protein